MGGDCNSQVSPSRTTLSFYTGKHGEAIDFQTLAGCESEVLEFRMRMSYVGGDCNSQVSSRRTTRSLYVDKHDEAIDVFKHLPVASSKFLRSE